MADHLFPLTLTQNDIYLDQVRHHDNPMYNVGGYIRLGRIDADRLADAHRELVCRHDVFGLRIVSGKGGVRQCIDAKRTTELALHDFSMDFAPEQAADEWIQSQFETAFSIEGTELFRAYLVKLSETSYRYVGVAHHLAMDGWGFSNWARELCLLNNDDERATVSASDWPMVAVEDEDYLLGSRYPVDRSFWSQQLQRLPGPLLSPRYRAAFERTDAVPSRRHCVEISQTLLNELKAVALSLGVGIPHVLLGTLATYFAKGSEHDKAVFGLPFHNRRNHRQKRMLGVFTGVSPLCVDLRDKECTVAQLIQAISQQQKATFRHQRYPIGHMVRDLGGSLDRRALYDVGFNYLKLDSDLAFGEQPASLVYLSHQHEATPLMVTMWEFGDRESAELQLDYNLAFFRETDVELLSDRLLHLLRSLPRNLHRRLSDVDVLPEHEVCRLLGGFGDADLDAAPNRCIHQLFEQQVCRTPDVAAVSSSGTTLTYRELNDRANLVARNLIAVGVRPETLIGICLERSAEVLVAVLGILKAGGAYLPLDPAYPPQRLSMILEDSGVGLVLTHADLAKLIVAPSVQPLLIETLSASCGADDDVCDPEVVGLSSESLAYVIYTSGSTGKPKGVEIAHANVVALLDWSQRLYTPAELARVLASTSLNFDLSVFEMFVPLSVGGEVVVVRDALALIDKPVPVTLINTVPSAMKVLIERNAIPADTLVVNLAGEALPMQLVNDLLVLKKCKKVINLYGPTEDTVYSTYAVFDTPIAMAPSIGRTISNTRAYVLTADGALASFGAIGELHLAGSGLARGYRNSPELTSRKFVSHPFSLAGTERLYRTGDLVRYLPDGQLEYLGRIDEQVKIRGFRVELSEIQQHLEQLDGVATACVLACESASAGLHLIAYVERKPDSTLAIARDDKAWGAQLRRALLVRLPAYMVPAAVVVLDQFPLTPNGKVDKSRLEGLEGVFVETGYVAPSTDTEITLAALWARALGINPQQVSATASLFDLGGHSLLLVRLAGDIQEVFDVELPLRALFDVSDLRDLALKIDTETTMRFIDERMNNTVALSEGCL